MTTRVKKKTSLHVKVTRDGPQMEPTVGVTISTKDLKALATLAHKFEDGDS